jgi:hypothetical protein
LRMTFLQIFIGVHLQGGDWSMRAGTSCRPPPVS